MGYYSYAGIPYGGTNIDFTGGSPSIYYVNRDMNIVMSNAVISNSNGDLLFYTNGVYIANADNDTMLNGDGLNPSAYTFQRDSDGLNITQSDIIIPFPRDTSKYYLFHVTLDSLLYIPLYLYYTIIDMSLDSGRGGVVSKNNILLYNATEFGGLTACKHGNGRDWWLICHEFNGDKYFKWLITPYGIQGPFTQVIGKVTSGNGVGQVAFSPDGNWFVNYEPEDDLDIIQFDRCTGLLSSCIHVTINDSANVGGVSFSPNSDVLYVSSTYYVYQFDLTAANISLSKTTVAVWDSFASPSPPFYTTFFLSQLAPDGKIYINTGNGTDKLHVINYPDSLGLSCNLQQHSISLPSYNFLTIPNYPNYFLERLVSSICDTLTAVTNLESGISDVNVFPNPANRLLYVQWRRANNLRKTELHIYNTMGQLMEVPFSILKDEYFELNVSQLPTGIYFIELLTEKEKIIKRFVKY